MAELPPCWTEHCMMGLGDRPGRVVVFFCICGIRNGGLLAFMKGCLRSFNVCFQIPLRTYLWISCRLDTGLRDLYRYLATTNDLCC